jgi:multidrug efflux pump subunit AcrA (membrane-fusion protein)
MIHKHIKSLPHHPKRVIIISLIVALSIGAFGYFKINKTLMNQVDKNGDLSAVKNLSLNFASSGKVKSVSVKAGDQVKRGEILATLTPDNIDGALAQAEAAYEIAQANYQKVINGATGTTIDLAKAAANTAKVNLDQATSQQNTLVANAYSNLLNSTPEAVPSDGISDYVAPVISGNYNLNKEGTLKVSFYYSNDGVSYNMSGLTNGTGSCNNIISQPLGDSGLYIKCSTTTINTNDWNIEIPNKKAANYLANKNAYELALQNRDAVVASAQAVLDQANASLESVVTSARPEDIAIAKAQVENAQGALRLNTAYNNTIISAPGDGTITAVYITNGQSVDSNDPAIGFLGLSN